MTFHRGAKVREPELKVAEPEEVIFAFVVCMRNKHKFDRQAVIDCIGMCWDNLDQHGAPIHRSTGEA
jgi:hypothetical protein